MTTKPPQESITRLLIAWGDGDQEALDALIPLVFDDLRGIAREALGTEAQIDVRVAPEAFDRDDRRDGASPNGDRADDAHGRADPKTVEIANDHDPLTRCQPGADACSDQFRRQDAVGPAGIIVVHVQHPHLLPIHGKKRP